MPEISDYFFKYHKRGKHTVIFMIINQTTATTSYYQYMNIEGLWYVMKSVRSGAAVVYTYTAPVSTSASTGWTSRASLTYTTPQSAFGE